MTLLGSKRFTCRCICSVGLTACGTGDSSVPTPEPPSRLFDPLAYRSLPGSPRASGVRDGVLRSYVYRQGPLDVHLLTRSGPYPAVIATFPRSDRGIGIWFRPAPESTELYAGAAAGDAGVAAGGGLVAVHRDEGQHSLDGVRGTLKTDATHLSTEIVLLGSACTLRDHGDGLCLENAAGFLDQRGERLELDAERNALRIHRDPSDGKRALELLLIGTGGTHVTLRQRHESTRPASASAPARGQPIIELTNRSGIELEFVVLASDAAGATGEPLDREHPPAAFRLH